MTLNVSLRIPDGIVLASDSLGTASLSYHQKMNVPGVCPECQKSIEIKDVQTPPITLPASTWPYVQKVLPVERKFGIAVFGMGLVNGRSMYNHITEISPKLPTASSGDRFSEVRDFLVTYFQEQLVLDWRSKSIDPALQPDTFRPFGFQFVGFSATASGEPCAKTALVNIGKTPSVDTIDSMGCTWSGDGSVVSLLWPKTGAAANFPAFSLQDAIDYAKFLIRTTSDFQRFSGRMPTVGGEIDIALVTNHHGFRWIEQKRLYRMLESEEEKP